MPLSEHVQRVLEQMEQALYAEDPRLASTLKSTSSTGPGLDRRRLAIGVMGALAGLVLVLVGVMSQMIWVGAIGFLGMVVGGAYAATPSRTSRPQPAASSKGGPAGGQRKPRPGGPRGKGPRGPRASGTFMERMEQQWDKRKEQGPF